MRASRLLCSLVLLTAISAPGTPQPPTVPARGAIHYPEVGDGRGGCQGLMLVMSS